VDDQKTNDQTTETQNENTQAEALAQDNAAFLSGDPEPAAPKAPKGKGKPKAKAKAEKAPKQTACACGCGEWAKRTFRQGHDQRLLGLLQRVAKGHAGPADIARAKKQSQHPAVRASAKFTDVLVK